MSVVAPRVSVLMAVYNTEKYLGEALDSIIGQSFGDFELVALDDGSSDGSAQILRSYAEKEPRMRLISRGNKGLVATRNELLSSARSGLIAWMDSDDISAPERLALQAVKFDEDPELVCLGGATVCVDPEDRFLWMEEYPLAHEDILEMQEKGGAIRFATTMMRRDIAIEVGGFREQFKMGEDFDLLLRMSEVGKMANLPDVLYRYRQHLSNVCNSSMLSQYWWPDYREAILALARERRERGTDKLQRGEKVAFTVSRPANRKRQEAITYAGWAHAALRSENFPLADKYAWAAIRTMPFTAEYWILLLRIVGRKARALRSRGGPGTAS
jgi:glycosyltransferase involved in cell wall biosynthesis